MLEINYVKLFFQKYAEHENIKIMHGWITKLAEKINETGFTAGNISTWINRGWLPENRINNILNLEIPEHLKDLCKKCDKSPPETSKSPRGTTILTGLIQTYGEINDKAEKEGLSFQEQIEILNENRKLRNEIRMLREIISEKQTHFENISHLFHNQKKSGNRKKTPALCLPSCLYN